MSDNELRDLYIRCMVAMEKTIPSDISRTDKLKLYAKIIRDMSHDLQIYANFL